MTTWLKVADAAEHATVSADLIRQAVKDGDLVAYFVGKGHKEYRLRTDDVNDWMMSRPYEPSKRSA